MKMDKKDFYKIYLPALEQAFREDNEIEIPDPERYIADVVKSKQVSLYVDNFSDNFIDKVGYYLDARGHNFREIDGVPIDEYKKEIIDEMAILKKLYATE